MGDEIIIEMDSGETLEIKTMREIGVGHMIGKLEVITEGTIETSVTVDQGQVLEQVPIETGLDVSNVENMIICPGLPYSTSWQRGRTNTTNVQYGWRSDTTTDATNRYRSGQTEHKYYRS